MFMQSGGGGGWGSALDRDPKLVLEDIANDVISVQAARDDYGVVVAPEGVKVDDGQASNCESKWKEEHELLRGEAEHIDGNESCCFPANVSDLQNFVYLNSCAKGALCTQVRAAYDEYLKQLGPAWRSVATLDGRTGAAGTLCGVHRGQAERDSHDAECIFRSR